MFDNLPRCPCCGGEATYSEIYHHFWEFRMAVIQCGDCGLKIEHRGPADEIADTRAKVMAAWSCRIPQHKPCLIVSQYLYSRYCYFVAYDPETFLAQARACVEKLERYKRNEDDFRPIHYGDLDSKWYDPNREQHNVNDIGDIYFVIGDSVGELLVDAQEYYKKAERESRWDWKKDAGQKIAEHHDPSTVYGIIRSHFKLI